MAFRTVRLDRHRSLLRLDVMPRFIGLNYGEDHRSGEQTPSGAEALVHSTKDAQTETEAYKVDECTICFEPQNETYTFYPCGHATFCEKCALSIFHEGDKRCPNCRQRIQSTFKLYLK